MPLRPSPARGRRRLAAALAAAATVAGLAAAPALAHVGVTPTEVQPGQATTLTFTAPGERAVPAVALSVTVPQAARLASAEAVPGWKTEISGNTVVWSGGSIGQGTYAVFTAIVGMPDAEGPVPFRATLVYADGFHQTFGPVAYARAEAGASPGGGSSHGLALAALAVAAVALALALGGGMLSVLRWLRAGGGGPAAPDA